MTEATTERELTDGELKICCATFYQSDLVRMLLGDVLHPGGLALTRQMGEAIELKPEDRVLDVACGRGASAVALALRFGCHVTGVDFSGENLAAAKAHVAEQGMEQLTTFRQGDAERLPFDDCTFDAIVSECSFCTFPDKATAAAEMARVLKGPEEGGRPGFDGRRGGRLGLTDMTVNDELPEEIQTLLAWVACVAGAGPAEAYVATLKRAGFGEFAVVDQRDALLDLVSGVRHKLVGVELLQKLGKLDLGDLDLSEGKRLARLTVELIERGVVGYTLITARKVC
jgi:SAM-dependent methyltransferase